MRKIFIVTCLLFFFQVMQAQMNSWFTPYNDSSDLVNDANRIIQKMTNRIKEINPDIPLQPVVAIKNTQPFLIAIDSNTIHLPLWEEIHPNTREFLVNVSGGARESMIFFGLFFNGFYLVDEVGHSVLFSTKNITNTSYEGEWEANKLAILYWRDQGKDSLLNKCYQYAKKVLVMMKNPVPENEDIKNYLSKHYYDVAADPYQYGYIQMSQFIELYEDKNLSNFENYILSLYKK